MSHDDDDTKKNGHKKNGKTRGPLNRGPGPVTAWVDPGKLKFEPTRRQEVFQEIAMMAVEEGQYFRKEWFARTRKDAVFKKKPLRYSEWKAWHESAEFIVWFYSEFPDNNPTEHELRFMDGDFWDGMRDGLRERKEWAYKLYSKMRWGKDVASKDREQAREMQDFVGKGDESNGWRVVAEA